LKNVLRSPWLRAIAVILAAAAAFAVIWWRGPAWSDVANAFRAVRWRWVVAAIVLNLLSVVARSLAAGPHIHAVGSAPGLAPHSQTRPSDMPHSTDPTDPPVSPGRRAAS